MKSERPTRVPYVRMAKDTDFYTMAKEWADYATWMESENRQQEEYIDDLERIEAISEEVIAAQDEYIEVLEGEGE